MSKMASMNDEITIKMTRFDWFRVAQTLKIYGWENGHQPSLVLAERIEKAIEPSMAQSAALEQYVDKVNKQAK